MTLGIAQADALLSGSRSNEPQGSDGRIRANLLLVHGAWQGAWVWDQVVAMLAAEGVAARAFDLPGSGEDRTPASAVTMDAYAEAIHAQARAMPDGPLVLVGHSMGGAAITAAASARPELFSRLVYLCAFLPRPGESVASLAKEGHALGGGGPSTEMTEGGVASRLRPGAIAQTFFNDCAPEVAASLLPRFRPQPTAPVLAPATWSDGFRALPKTYIHCTRDRAVSSQLQLLMASRAGVRDVQTLDSGHEPFISQPDRLTQLLLRAVAGA